VQGGLRHLERRCPPGVLEADDRAVWMTASEALAMCVELNLTQHTPRMVTEAILGFKHQLFCDGIRVQRVQKQGTGRTRDGADCGWRRRYSGVGPVGTAVGKAAYGCENKLLFGRNTPQIAIFMVVPPFLSSYNQTGGSDVRGKAVPNWVRKVFNCLRSL
jgi:hypothetical protein